MSASEPEQTRSLARRLTIIDLAKELRRLGRGNEADYYITTIPTMLYLRGFNLEDVYTMNIEDVEMELRKPPTPIGWDNTVWGKEIVCPQ